MGGMRKGLLPGVPSAYQVVGVSVLVDLTDVVLNGIIAIVSGSVVMMAETLQGGADLLAAIFLYIGLRRAARPKHGHHPFGHGRELYVWTFFSALLMLTVTSTLSFYFGWQRLIDPRPIAQLPIAIIILLFALLTNGYAFSLSYRRLKGGHGPRRMSKRFFASPLIETKTTAVLDLLGVSSALLGSIALVVSFMTGDSRLDGLGAMLIGVVMAGFAVILILANLQLLVGQRLSRSTEDRIRDVVHRVPGVRAVTDLRTLVVGPEGALVDLDVVVGPEMLARQVEQIIIKVKLAIKEAFPEVVYVQIELETHQERR